MITNSKAKYIAALSALLLAGCPSNAVDVSAAGSGGSAGLPGTSAGGTRAGASASAAGSARGGQGGTGGDGFGNAGGSAGDACANLAIPALCKVCADNSCGTPMCSGGKFTGFVCTDGSDAGAAGSSGVAGGGVCNLACVQGKHCVASPTPTCVDDAPATGSLQWVPSCGEPVCRADNNPYDAPQIPNCTTEKIGTACATEGQRCDGVLSCGATYLCAAAAPHNCPISRASYKQDISYLDDAERTKFYEHITQLRLATYRYKSAPNVPQLGFMIDDVEPSVAVSGDHVNLYGYLSMAVAAIQVQDQRIKTLERELAQLRPRAAPRKAATAAPKR